ncbi:hypothetical protein HCA61_21970 [Rhodococcus sp. HNM0563]|uniref:hypothetical protein n=1 Tax=Rhodococcus sp. HNM0563 TaxID=2716339 RepID=UPI00146C83C3|nr:hypothetical protein [Rhodococcus sp. HNM0563]NLU64908.1 hypothetical protein [Rhodococcus sp. HNM0563]
MGEPWADRERLAAAADLLAEKVDVLLDRIVDSAIGPARAHSADQLRDDSEARLLTRIAIEHLAGMNPALDVQRALRAGMTWDQIGGAAGIGANAARARWSAGKTTDPHPTPEPAPAPREQARRHQPGRRRAVDDQQMPMF